MLSHLGWSISAGVASLTGLVWLCTSSSTTDYLLSSHSLINDILSSTSSSSLVNQISTINQTFPDFLSHYDANDLIWITLADIYFSQTCTPHLQHFIRTLEPYGDTQREHRLITLCIDPGCMATCKEKGWACYGEYEHTRPEIILPATWPKLAGLIDTLETGRDVIFVDSDVFFKENPLDKLAPLGDYDLQIQDEAIDGNVNTGFFHMTSSPASIAHWRGVLEKDLKQVSRDQANTNILLGSSKLRTLEQERGAKEVQEGNLPFKSEFKSQNGLSVKVIEPTTIYAHHMSFSWPHLSFQNAVAYHGTCLENRYLKHYLPREYGYWQDVDGYYSAPPKMLELPSLVGTREEVGRMWRAFAKMANETGRAMLPPPTITILLPHDGGGKSVTRNIWSIFPAEDLDSLPALEANYISHALPYHLDDPSTVQELLDTNYINVNAYKTVEEVIEVLTSERAGFKEKRVVTLRDWRDEGLDMEDGEGGEMSMCAYMEMPLGCDATCRTA